MRIEFDPDKSARNAQELGLPFELVAELDRDLALTTEDGRKEYGETRFVAYAPLVGRLHVVFYTLRAGVVRMISFREANSGEERKYASSPGERGRRSP
jgi:uncharacterized DUF497 family protein